MGLTAHVQPAQPRLRVKSSPLLFAFVPGEYNRTARELLRAGLRCMKIAPEPLPKASLQWVLTLGTEPTELTGAGMAFQAPQVSGSLFPKLPAAAFPSQPQKPASCTRQGRGREKKSRIPRSVTPWASSSQHIFPEATGRG